MNISLVFSAIFTFTCFYRLAIHLEEKGELTSEFEKLGFSSKQSK